MGSGIAAHLASCGIRTLLLDIVPPGETSDDPAKRSAFAANGLQGALKAKPAAFVDKRAASLIEVGNFDDDMAKIAECDWTIEVVLERMDVKRSLFEKVEKHYKPGSIVSSNTSGLSIAGMLEGRSAAFKEHFLGTHFFNPVRYMHLLEIINGPDTKPEVVETIAHFVRRFLGKGVVYAKDTTNFIANRIGVYGMMSTIHAMKELGYSIEEVDAIVGKPMGRPKSAAFRTADVVGLDTFVHVSQNCYDSLTEDPEREVFKVPDFIKGMVDKGLRGQKSGGGFYKKVGKDIQTIDLDTLEYRPNLKADLPGIAKAKKAGDLDKRLAALVNDDGRAGKFAWHVMSRSLAYAANIAWEIADDVANIDRAMRWGFNWEQGPFEAWEAIGVEAAAKRMRADGLTLPGWVDEAIAKGGFYVGGKCAARDGQMVDVPAIPGQLLLGPIKASGGVIEKNRGATLVDLGDGIAGLEFHTKMNTVDADLTQMIYTACDIVERDFDGLVVGNEAEHFSAGANLMLVVMNANQKKWDALDEMVNGFQQAVQRLTYCAKPVVTAPHGLCLGGGCEMAMASDVTLFDKETYMGLVEVGVGLIPGGGGHLNLLKRVLANIPANSGADRLPAIQRAFEAIGLAKVATGGGEAFDIGFGRIGDKITFNRDTRLADAKRWARFLADQGYTPPMPADNLVLPGRHGAAAVDLFVYGMKLSGYASDHDHLIAKKVGYVLCGGDTDGRSPVSEQHILDIEREAFLSLCGEQKSIDRMQFMLTKNKPLRN
jgi:3-hydroxyacyl-CoA dehydrogenase